MVNLIKSGLIFLAGILSAFGIVYIAASSGNEPPEPLPSPATKISPVQPDENLYGYTSNEFAVDKDVFFGINAPKLQIVKSTDRGATWPAVYKSGNKNIDYIFKNGVPNLFFITDSHGWLAGHDQTWETLDGGSNWNKIFSQSLDWIFFADKNNGWMQLYAGKKDRSYKTRDGGKTWRPCRRNQGNSNLWKEVFFISPTHGWAFTEQYHPDNRSRINGLAETLDGGCHWKKISKITELDDWAADLFFVNEKTGWFATNSQLFKTKNGGKTWQKIIIPDEEAQIEAFFFKNKKEGWLLFASDPEKPIFYRTADAGVSWTPASKDEFFRSYRTDVKFPRVSDRLRRAVVIQSLTEEKVVGDD